MTTAKNYLSLGESFEEKGKYFKAERLYKKALKAVEREGQDCTDELIPYFYNLGMVQAALDKTSLSIKNLGKVLSLLLESRDEEHPDVKEVRMVIDQLHPQITQQAVNS